jgi:hypothetical protein
MVYPLLERIDIITTWILLWLVHLTMIMSKNNNNINNNSHASDAATRRYTGPP